MQNNIEKIVKIFTDHVDVEYTSRLVPNKDIAEQGYNLSVSTYVEQEDTRETVDITKLNVEIERIVAREDVLRREINAIIAEIEGGAA
jgi:type I restriction enzyme M protein